MHRSTMYIIGGVALVALIALSRRASASTPPIQPEEVPLDPFAQSRFEEKMQLVMLLPSFARAGVALAQGLSVPNPPSDSVVVPRGVSWPVGSPVSSGTKLFRLN